MPFIGDQDRTKDIGADKIPFLAGVLIFYPVADRRRAFPQYIIVSQFQQVAKTNRV
jgi:hypothetical protein